MLVREDIRDAQRQPLPTRKSMSSVMTFPKDVWCLRQLQRDGLSARALPRRTDIQPHKTHVHRDRIPCKAPSHFPSGWGGGVFASPFKTEEETVSLERQRSSSYGPVELLLFFEPAGETTADSRALCPDISWSLLSKRQTPLSPSSTCKTST